MANFADLLKKIANNSRLTPQELDELGRFGTEIQQRNSFVAGNTNPQNLLNISFPFTPIYSEVLEVDIATKTIIIPSGYKHLFILGAGRINGTGGQNTAALFGRFNGDSGNNYTTSYLLQASGVASATETIGTSRVVLGDLSADGAASGFDGAFMTYIPHYLSSYYKQSLMYGGTATATHTFLANRQGVWMNTDQIQSVTILPDTTYPSAKIEKGTAFSIYGII